MRLFFTVKYLSPLVAVTSILPVTPAPPSHFLGHVLAFLPTIFGPGAVTSLWYFTSNPPAPPRSTEITLRRADMPNLAKFTSFLPQPPPSHKLQPMPTPPRLTGGRGWVVCYHKPLHNPSSGANRDTVPTSPEACRFGPLGCCGRQVRSCRSTRSRLTGCADAHFVRTSMRE